MDSLTKETVRNSLASLFIRISAMLLGILLSMYIARELGPEGIGVYNFVNSFVSLSLIIVMLGTQSIITKTVAIAKSKNNFQDIREIINSTYILNGGFSIITICGIFLLLPWILNSLVNKPHLIIPLYIGSIAIFPQVLSRIWGAGLIGYKKIW